MTFPRTISAVPRMSRNTVMRNLSHLDAIEYDKDAVELEENDEKILIDVSQWGLTYVKNDLPCKVTHFEMHDAKTSDRFQRILVYGTHVSIIWRQLGVTFQCETTGETKTEKFILPSDSDISGLIKNCSTVNLSHALPLFLVVMGKMTETTDPLAELRGYGNHSLQCFLTWVFNRISVVNFVTDTVETIGELVALYELRIKILLGRTVEMSLDISEYDEAGDAVIIHEVTGTGPYASVVDKYGNLHTDVLLESVGVVHQSPAWYAAMLLSQCGKVVQRMLRRRHGHAIFTGIPPDDFKKLVDFIDGDGIESVALWKKLIANYLTIDLSQIVQEHNFSLEWMTRHMRLPAIFPGRSDTYSALSNYSGNNVVISELDISEFAKSRVPNNPLVASITMLKSGKVRVVLREPVYPDTIQRRGVVYAEIEPGTTMKYMAVHAFDLDFRGTLSKFPSAHAYADAECTIPATHSNITSSGHVCLGNINTAPISDGELEAKGGIPMPNISDFIQMLRQCNLDSAYHRSKSFMFIDSENISDEMYNAARWEIPGLYVISSQLTDFEKLLNKSTT